MSGGLLTGGRIRAWARIPGSRASGQMYCW